MHIDGSEAFSNTLRNKFRKYPDRGDARYDNHFLFPEITPGFTIPRDSSVFTIGSCFARNVEEALVRNGMTVPTAEFAAPQKEAPGRPNRILNQYNPATMLQCLQAAETAVTEAGLYEDGADQVIDCLLATGSRGVSRARAIERRSQINDLYSRGLDTSETVVVTLGLIESWYDHESGLYLNEAPPHKLVKRSKGRFEFRRLDAAACRKMLFEILERLIDTDRRNVMLTVSPVPLQVTFAGDDAVTANAYSKAVLRVVAEEARETFARLDYFPSYEIVTTAGLRSFGEDNVHVRPAVVEWIVDRLVSAYLR